MKLNNIIASIFVYLLFVSTSIANGTSIQWQQIELEEKLKNTFSKYLSLHLEEEKYFVHLKVNSKEQTFSLPSHNLKFKSSTDKFIKKNIPASLSADLIALEKVGVFAPKFENQDNKEMELKLFQYKNKLERDLIKKTNVFEFIESITVSVAVDKTIDKKIFDQVKLSLQKIIPKIGKIKFEVETYQVEFKQKAGANQGLVDQIIGKITAAGSSVGLVFATIIFSLTLIILFSKYKGLQELLAATASGGDQDSSPQTIESKELVDSDLRPGSPQLAEAISSTVDGMSRFALYLEKSPLQTINLVKKWINLGTTDSKSALYILSERLTIDELTLIFSDLNMEERENFSSVSALQFSKSEKQFAESYISQQVLEDILYITHDIDKELEQLLVELTPKKAAEIAITNFEMGALLLNLMGVEFVSEMIKYLPTEKLGELSVSGLSVSADELNQSMEKLKTILKESTTEVSENSFGRRMVELLKSLEIRNEEEMINVLIEQGKLHIVRDYAATSLPACLAFKINGEVMKNALYKFDLAYKVEFLVSVGEELREEILNKISQEGTKGRDLLQHEIDTILGDEAHMARVMAKKEKYYSDIVWQIRSHISALSNKSDILQDVSMVWLRELDSSSAFHQQKTEAAAA